MYNIILYVVKVVDEFVYCIFFSVGSFDERYFCVGFDDERYVIENKFFVRIICKSNVFKFYFGVSFRFKNEYF